MLRVPCAHHADVPAVPLAPPVHERRVLHRHPPARRRGPAAPLPGVYLQKMVGGDTPARLVIKRRAGKDAGEL